MKSNPWIFISCRRTVDSILFANSIARSIEKYFEELCVCLDLDLITEQEEWNETINNRLFDSKLVLLIIDSNWFSEDLFVDGSVIKRIIFTALIRQIPIIPIIIDKLKEDFDDVNRFPKDISELAKINPIIFEDKLSNESYSNLIIKRICESIQCQVQIEGSPATHHVGFFIDEKDVTNSWIVYSNDSKILELNVQKRKDKNKISIGRHVIIIEWDVYQGTIGGGIASRNGYMSKGIASSIIIFKPGEYEISTQVIPKSDKRSFFIKFLNGDDKSHRKVIVTKLK